MISKTAIHAIKALAMLARFPEGTYLGAGAIAREIGAPANYLGKLLQNLSHNGLVISQKGQGGGFRLGRPPSAITLLDAVEFIDHVSRWNGCLLGGGRCSGEAPCAVHQRWGAVRETYLNFLTETTIADLLGQPLPGERLAMI